MRERGRQKKGEGSRGMRGGGGRKRKRERQTVSKLLLLEKEVSCDKSPPLRWLGGSI